MLLSRCSFLEVHQWCQSTDSRCWLRRHRGILGSVPENTTPTPAPQCGSKLRMRLFRWLRQQFFLQELQMNQIWVSVKQTALWKQSCSKQPVQNGATPESHSQDNSLNKYSNVLRMFFSLLAHAGPSKNISQERSWRIWNRKTKSPTVSVNSLTKNTMYCLTKYNKQEISPGEMLNMLTYDVPCTVNKTGWHNMSQLAHGSHIMEKRSPLCFVFFSLRFEPQLRVFSFEGARRQFHMSGSILNHSEHDATCENGCAFGGSWGGWTSLIKVMANLTQGHAFFTTVHIRCISAASCLSFKTNHLYMKAECWVIIRLGPFDRLIDLITSEGCLLFDESRTQLNNDLVNLYCVSCDHLIHLCDFKNNLQRDVW